MDTKEAIMDTKEAILDLISCGYTITIYEGVSGNVVAKATEHGRSKATAVCKEPTIDEALSALHEALSD